MERSGQPRWFGRRQVQSPSTRTAQHEAAVLDSDLLAAVVGPERKERSSWDGPGGSVVWPSHGIGVDRSCQLGVESAGDWGQARVGSVLPAWSGLGGVGGLSSSAFRLGWSVLPKSLTSGGSMKEYRLIGSQPDDATGTVAFEGSSCSRESGQLDPGRQGRSLVTVGSVFGPGVRVRWCS